MEYFWNSLDPEDKRYHKAELIDFKSQYDRLNKDFLDYQKANKRDIEDNDDDELTKLQDGTREKLLGGVGKLSSQEKQLEGIVKDGHEAQTMLREGGKNLRLQRDHIENAGKHNLRAQNELHKADKTIRYIRVREF